MKSIYNIFKAVAIAAAFVALAVSCQPAEDNVAKAVLGDVSSMNFDARSPKPQTVTVYSDGEWHTTAPEWITVTPSAGNGVTEVTVTASENADAGGLLEPRKDTLIFSGNTLASRLLVFVSQEGDTYRNAVKVSLEEMTGLANGKAFIIDEATVAAVTTAGYVVTDGKVNVYAKTSAKAATGDKVSIKGVKASENGLPVISPADEFSVSASGSFDYPDPADLNAKIASYSADKYEYVSVSGLVAGGNLLVTVDETDYSIKQIDCPSELGISTLNGNKVELTGYICGLLGANMFGILTTSVKDNGPAVMPRPEKLLYAKWRFTTSLYPAYASFFGGTAGVVDLTAGSGGMYVPSNVEGNGKLEYWQVDKTGTTPSSGNPKRIVGGTGHPYVTGAWPGDYWLFSATDNYEYPAGTSLHIKYLTRISGTGQKYWMLEYFDGKDWQPADEYPVNTNTETGETVQYNFINPTSNVAVECYWKLAAACREPMFRMRCVANWQSNGSGALANPNGGTVRIADNDDGLEDAGPVFEVTDAPETGGGIPAGTVVFEDDFEWLAPYATAAKAPDDVTNNSVGSSPNIFTTAALAGILEELQTKGYGFIWGGKSGLEWSTETPTDGNGRTLYLQSNYFKFGKSDYSSGIILPALSGLTSSANVELTFDWCWCMTGASKPDTMTLTVQIDGGGEDADTHTSASADITSAQPTADDLTKLEWQHASVKVNGAGSATRLTIRPTNYDPYVSNTRGQNRWYLDNVKVTVVK